MIRITVTKSQGHYQSLEITGHADSDEYGKDLVCAIVSGITTGLCNALSEMVNEEDIVLKEGYVYVQIHHQSEKTDIILETGMIQLQTVEEVNKEFIKIKITEV